MKPLESDNPTARLLARQALEFKRQRDQFRHCLEQIYACVHTDENGKREFDFDGFDAIELQIETLLFGIDPEKIARRQAE